MKQRTKGFICIAFLSCIMISLLALICHLDKQDAIVINEICSNNFNVVLDENGEYTDYVELWNTTEEPQTLVNYYLSDDQDELKKFSLADVVIPAHEYYLLFLNGEKPEELGQKTFKISKNGETLYLYDDARGKIVDTVLIPKLSFNKVYGCIEDGSRQRSVMEPSPGKTNNGVRLYPTEVLEAPTMSVNSGFYDEDFDLYLSSPSGNKIYYTLDGSNPTKDSFLYRGGIHITDATPNENVYAARIDLSPTKDYVPSELIDKATVVKAFAYNPRANTCSPIVTGTFFVGFDGKEEYKDFSVVSLVVDPEKLFDKEKGIYTSGEALEKYKAEGGLLEDGTLLGSYVDSDGDEHYLYEASNAFHRGKDWERDANITYFNRAHQYIFSQKIGIRISGASTRGVPQKSFKLYGRNAYDERATFPYAFFENTEYSSVKLRNGGSNNGDMMMQDAFLESLLTDYDVAIQAAEPTILFLNGEYWGIYNIRERYTAEYLENHYGVSKDNVWIIDADTAQEGGEEALEAFRSMKELVEECDLSIDEVYEMATNSLDMQSLIDYLCINLYLSNYDIDFNQNMALWKTVEPEDGPYGDCKWRFMVFDLDDTLKRYDPVESRGWYWSFALFQTPFVQSLIQNEGFRRQLCKTMVDMLDTTFDYEKMHQELMAWRDVYRDQTVRTNQRFYGPEYTEETFDLKIEKMDNFFKYRKEFILQELNDALGLEGLLEN